MEVDIEDKLSLVKSEVEMEFPNRAPSRSALPIIQLMLPSDTLKIEDEPDFPDTYKEDLENYIYDERFEDLSQNFEGFVQMAPEAGEREQPKTVSSSQSQSKSLTSNAGKKKKNEREMKRRQETFVSDATIPSYSKETPMEVLTAIKDGYVTFKEAEMIYGIPISTFRVRAKEKASEEDNRGTEIGLFARHVNELTKWILRMAAISYGRIKKDIPDIVKEILDKDNCVSHFENNRPSVTWVYQFLNERPELNARIPEYSSIYIAEEGIKAWFRGLEDFLTREMGINAKDFLTSKNGRRVYHCSEISFSLNEAHSEAEITQLGSNSKYQISVVGCVAASGHFCKPLVTYPGESPAAFHTSDINPSDFHVTSSDSGFISQNIFYDWLSNAFYPEIKDSVLFPIILFSDGLSVHLNLAVTQFCKDNNIIIYCFPPHTSHILQPLDISIYARVKSNWNYTFRTWSENNPGSPLSKTNFLRIFDSVWRKSSKPEEVILGFRKAGLVPFGIKNLNLPEADSSECALTNAKQRQVDTANITGIQKCLQIVENNIGSELKIQFENWYDKSIELEGETFRPSLWRIYKQIRSVLEDALNQNQLNGVCETPFAADSIKANNCPLHPLNAPLAAFETESLVSNTQSSSSSSSSSESESESSEISSSSLFKETSYPGYSEGGVKGQKLNPKRKRKMREYSVVKTKSKLSNQQRNTNQSSETRSKVSSVENHSCGTENHGIFLNKYHGDKTTLRRKIEEMWNSGMSSPAIAWEVAVSLATVRRWIKRWQEEKTVMPRRKKRTEKVNIKKSGVRADNPSTNSFAITKKLGLDASVRAVTRRLQQEEEEQQQQQSNVYPKVMMTKTKNTIVLPKNKEMEEKHEDGHRVCEKDLSEVFVRVVERIEKIFELEEEEEAAEADFTGFETTTTTIRVPETRRKSPDSLDSLPQMESGNERKVFHRNSTEKKDAKSFFRGGIGSSRYPVIKLEKLNIRDQTVKLNDAENLLKLKPRRSKRYGKKKVNLKEL